MPISFDVGSLVGGLASLASANQYNRSQERIAQQANEYNYKMFQEANAFNRQERLETQDYNRSLMEQQMAYNNPAAQAARLSAAGFNPANMYKGDAGNLQSVPNSSPASSASASPYVTPNQMPLMSSQDISNILGSVSSALLNKEEIKGKQIDNEFARNRQQAEIDNLIESRLKSLSDRSLNPERKKEIIANIKKLESDRELIAIQNRREQLAYKYDDQMLSNIVQQQLDTHNKTLVEQESIEIANKIQNMFGKRLASAQLNAIQEATKETIQRVSNLVEEGKLTKQQVKTETARTLSEEMNSQNLQIDNQYHNRIVDLTVQSLEKNVRQQGADYWNPFKYALSPAVGALSSLGGKK